MITEIKSFYNEYLESYTNFHQIDLMNEMKIVVFFKDRGISVGKRELSRFVELGWITRGSESNLFHPFRIFPCIFISHLRSLKINDKELPAYHCSEINKVQWANEISNLAILLEPIYWPKITSKKKNASSLVFLNWEEFDEGVKTYKQKILAYVKSLNPEIWSNYHDSLRTEAAELDNNSELYILLRLSPWEKRAAIKGDIGVALWLRHIAEVLRLAFEEVHGVQWAEEYEAFGFWYEGARTKLYGSERPIENGLITRPHLAFEFGLHTGSTVRWYVEGETEYQAALYALPNACLGGIEIINLKGVFKENANAPMRLVDHLKNDKELRRFSFISFDGDRADNIRFVKKNIELENIVGCVNINRPDFEFENFTVNELIKIAIKFDKTLGYDSKNLMSENKENIDSGGAFDNFYRKYSARGTSLKGKGWGEALAEYSLDNPLKEDTQQRRTFLQTIDQILHASRVRYDYQSENFAIDPDDFQIKEKDSFI